MGSTLDQSFVVIISNYETRIINEAFCNLAGGGVAGPLIVLWIDDLPSFVTGNSFLTRVFYCK